MKEGWECKKLGEVGEFVRGGNFSKKDFVEDGFPCIHYGQIHMRFGVETFKHLSSVPAEMVKPDRCAKKGDLVIAITSEDDAGSCKCTAWMGDYDAYVGGHAAIYRHTMQPKYVSYYFMSPFFQKDKLEFTHGFKVVEISPKDIAKIKIPVPPLSEQQSIVDYLDSAFAKIDAMKANAEKALNEAKALFQASLKEMLEPKEGWEEKTLKETCSVITDGTHHSPINTANGKYKYVTAKNIKPWGLDLRNITFVSEDVHKEIVSRCCPQKGDVLYIKDGATTGIAIVNPLDEEFSLLSSVALIRPNKNIMLSEYLCYALNSPSIYEQTRSQMDGAAITRVTLVKIKGFTIPLPPLSEQQSIVATLDSLKSKVDKLQENYDKISQECDALKQAILRQVFE